MDWSPLVSLGLSVLALTISAATWWEQVLANRRAVITVRWDSIARTRAIDMAPPGFVRYGRPATRDWLVVTNHGPADAVGISVSVSGQDPALTPRFVNDVFPLPSLSPRQDYPAEIVTMTEMLPEWVTVTWKDGRRGEQSIHLPVAESPR